MASGGVCAVLDYEIDQITEYVAEMAQRIILPTSQVSPSFRKFVSGLLSSTRLPSTTILLGMNYLARRMNLLNAVTQYKATDGIVWRSRPCLLHRSTPTSNDHANTRRPTMVTTRLPRESDQSLVTNLPTIRALLDTTIAPMPLAPIDTNVQRPRQYSTTYNGYNKTSSRERPESGYQSAYDQSGWMSSYPTPHLTPPSAPDSGLNTPEYMSATGGAPRYNDWAVFNTAARAAYQPQTYATYIPSHHLASYHTPFVSYHNGYASIWEGHGHITPECTCVNCNPYAKQQQSHFMGHGYNQQVVA
ncbi:uncharacterized protein PAC_11868 [Phialocephala subalpina]|uniref:Uncharacterized protein n=1 Tax=Phialocephala subalpina TaxID=576137 RepID=A0A1L7XAB9_9HELO|nr:uncharacterized protein PAC_11868 [Phialocephala subalpina]